MNTGPEHILVTGANGNLGNVVIAHLIRSGFHVIAVAGRNGLIDQPDDPMVDYLRADLSDEHSVRILTDKVLERGGQLKGAVLLAGGFSTGTLTETGEEELQAMFRLNFLTAYHIVRALSPHFQAQDGGGQFITVGARPALRPQEGRSMVAYTLSKTLVKAFTEMVDASAGGAIRATTIIPGIIDTEANRRAMPDADRSSWVSPQAIAEIIGFKFSDAGKAVRNTDIIL